jgi:ribosomal protein S18 acetylase RimI-like enzyme
MLAHLFAELSPYQPALVGTFPLGLTIASSDIDIACFATDLVAFEGDLCGVLHRRGVEVTVSPVRVDPPGLVASFTHDGTAFEVFAQPIPVHTQAGFRHMIVEGRLLSVGGAALRDRILAAKRAGAKTEPAFAALLGLPGDPFASMLALEHSSPAALHALVAAALGDAPPAITLHAGPRADLLPLFRIADDSETEIAGYLELGDVLLASGNTGHVQLIDVGAHTMELKSLAVVESQRGTGLGRRLVEAALAHARARGATRVVLSTATADAQLLRFYQRRGFRMRSIDRDIFVPANGYPPDLMVDGIPLRDRVWFDITP